MSYKLTENDLRQIAEVVKEYLNKGVGKIYGNEIFDSVSKGDVRFSFYKEYSSFSGDFFHPGTFNTKGRFEGNVRNNQIVVSEESKTNYVYLTL